MHSFIITPTPDRMQGKRQNRLHCVPLKARETWLPSIGHVLNGRKSPRTVDKSNRQHNCSALKPLRWLYYYYFFHQTESIRCIHPPRTGLLYTIPYCSYPTEPVCSMSGSIPLHSVACYHLDFTCIVLQGCNQSAFSFSPSTIPSLISSLFRFTKRWKGRKQVWALTVCTL